MLGIEAGGLLLHGAEGAGNGDGRKGAFSLFRHIKIRGELDAVAVVERDFAVIDQFGLRECFIPFLRKIQGAHMLFFGCFRLAGKQHQGCGEDR